MQIVLYPDQLFAKMRVYGAWAAGARSVLMVMPTGSGKTVVFTDIVQENPGPSIVVAHRHELVSQASIALGRRGVRHRVIGSASTVHACIQSNISELNYNWVRPDSHTAVASVDTLARRTFEPWMGDVTLLVQDEAHHMLRDNKWGRVLELFPNARVLGVTAETQRADGKGLGRHAAGVMNALVVGSTTRELITIGRLSQYRVFAPPSTTLDLSSVATSASGDFSPKPLSAAVHKARIVGNVVDQYLKVCPGAPGITFAVDVAAADELAAGYRARGVTAEVVTADTPPLLRRTIVRKLADGRLNQVVNVDIFGEGFDSPAVVSVSMARPTQSRQMYLQQAGRMMRVADGKLYGILNDHVGNVSRHGLPDAPHVQTLDGRARHGSGQAVDVPIRICPACTAAFERFLRVCPVCGCEIKPETRSSIAAVDGDLYELDPEVLAQMWKAVDKPVVIPYWASPIVVASVKKHHRERAAAQAELRDTMARWGGAHTATGATVREAQRMFYRDYGIDVLTAQTLNARDALELKGKLK